MGRPLVNEREQDDAREALALAEGRLALLIKAVEKHLGFGHVGPRSQDLREALAKARGKA